MSDPMRGCHELRSFLEYKPRGMFIQGALIEETLLELPDAVNWGIAIANNSSVARLFMKRNPTVEQINFVMTGQTMTPELHMFFVLGILDSYKGVIMRENHS